MGLDLFIYSTKHRDSNPDYIEGASVNTQGNCKSYPFLRWAPEYGCYTNDGATDTLYEEAYWRKNWFICDFFGARYHEAVLEDKGDEYNAEEVDFNCSYLKLTPEMVKDCMDAIKDYDLEYWIDESNGYSKYDCIKMLSDVYLKMLYWEEPLDFYVSPWW